MENNINISGKSARKIRCFAGQSGQKKQQAAPCNEVLPVLFTAYKAAP